MNQITPQRSHDAIASSAVLVVDDDPVQRRLVDAALTKFGYRTILASGGEEGIAAIEGPQGREIAAVVLDLVMPGMGGLDMLARLRQRANAAPVIVQTSQGGIESVIAAMRAGAFDFVVKPVAPERLRTAIVNALKVEALKVEAQDSDARQPRRQAGGALTFRDMITSSPTMERVVRLGQKAAASNIPILIEGESGTGKELVARAIQGSSDRKARPFVTVNCGAIPDNLVESILFGHEKGAFTGATEKHSGKFVEANGGTLFLDEIGDLPLEVQVKLLRAVQEGEIETVGARGTQKVDIRLISATHRNLLQRVKDGQFREDLFYRLNVFPIFVPPLRDRRDDIPALVAHFIRQIQLKEHRGKVSGISPQALAMLAAYDWPGNIRQLENAVFRAVVLADGETLTSDDFPQIRVEVDGIDFDRIAAEAPAPSLGIEAAVAVVPQKTGEERNLSGRFGIVRALDDVGNVRTLADVELEMILFAIDHYRGQMSEVARRLGIGRSTLYRKLKEHGIDPDDGRPVAAPTLI
jgi:DNA-binding NtrC family response regulator